MHPRSRPGPPWAHIQGGSTRLPVHTSRYPCPTCHLAGTLSEPKPRKTLIPVAPLRRIPYSAPCQGTKAYEHTAAHHAHMQHMRVQLWDPAEVDAIQSHAQLSACGAWTGRGLNCSTAKVKVTGRQPRT